MKFVNVRCYLFLLVEQCNTVYHLFKIRQHRVFEIFISIEIKYESSCGKAKYYTSIIY